MEKKKEAAKQDNTKEAKSDKDKEIKDLTESLQRLQAEFQNYQKRCEKSNEDFMRYAISGFIEKLLGVVDTFELAFKSKDSHEQFVKGTEMIYGQLYEVLEKEGLRPIKSVGEKFDAYKHEVLLTEKTDKDEEDDIITEELQRGYMLKDKVLRFAKVKVKKKV